MEALNMQIINTKAKSLLLNLEEMNPKYNVFIKDLSRMNFFLINIKTNEGKN